jgi:hypothetical protein
VYSPALQRMTSSSVVALATALVIDMGLAQLCPSPSVTTSAVTRYVAAAALKDEKTKTATGNDKRIERVFITPTSFKQSHHTDINNAKPVIYGLLSYFFPVCQRFLSWGACVRPLMSNYDNHPQSRKKGVFCAVKGQGAPEAEGVIDMRCATVLCGGLDLHGDNVFWVGRRDAAGRVRTSHRYERHPLWTRHGTPAVFWLRLYGFAERGFGLKAQSLDPDERLDGTAFSAGRKPADETTTDSEHAFVPDPAFNGATT